MIRLVIFILYGVGLLFLNRFVGENVTSTIDVPAQVEAGKSFTVDVTINKGMVSGFSRFQQEIPAGLKASLLESDQAEFRFEEKKAKFLWFNLPQKETLSLSYQVDVDARLKGEFVIEGDFAYVEDNERKSLKISSQPIEIEPSKEVDPQMIVHIDDFERLITPDLTQQHVLAVRQRPAIESDGGALIHILINKQDRGKFAKIEESIPAGYLAEPVETQRGIFTARGNTVKFLWMDLPDDPHFIVSYRLTPKPELQTMGALSIQGAFSYIEGSETVSVGIQQKELDLNKLTPEQMHALLAGDELDESLVDQTSGRGTDSDITAKASVEDEGNAISDAIVRETADKSPEEDELPVNNLAQYASDNTQDPSYVLQPESGIYYRVQLAAGHRPVMIDQYFKQYNLGREVKREQHEGWYKYSVGSFEQYKSARDYRVRIWNTTSIDDAFVAAYNEGQRITVQEALMISNQKWYR